MEYKKTDLPFGAGYHFSDELSIVPTPGHTLGHHSVLLDVGAYQVLFAGDTTFNQAQLLSNEVGGINFDIGKSKKTLEHIRLLSQRSNLIYLPSHDPKSGERLKNLEQTILS